jgi:hypothetical protein
VPTIDAMCVGSRAYQPPLFFPPNIINPKGVIMSDYELQAADVRTMTSWEGAADRALRAKHERDRIVKSILIEGLDYGTIPGTTKPVIYKPGCEKVADALNLWPDYELVRSVEDFERPLFHYAYRCNLRLRGSNIVVASGIGSCNSMEKKYRYTKDGREQPVTYTHTIVNTIDKMAQVRAAKQATLNFGFSEYFTQDWEELDTEPHEGTTVPVPKPTHGSEAAHDPGDSTGDAGQVPGAITPKQASRAWAIANAVAKRLKRPSKDIMQAMLESYGVTDVRSLPRDVYDEFIESMEASQ